MWVRDLETFQLIEVHEAPQPRPRNPNSTISFDDWELPDVLTMDLTGRPVILPEQYLPPLLWLRYPQTRKRAHPGYVILAGLLMVFGFWSLLFLLSLLLP